MDDGLPPARLRDEPGASTYAGVEVRRVRSARTPEKVYWYWAVKEGRGRRRYYPYTAEGLQAAITAANARG